MAARSSERKSAPIIAGFVSAAIFFLIGWLLGRKDPGFASFTPHPTLFIALLVASRYGFAGGMWSAIFSTAAYGALLLLMVDVPSAYNFLGAPYSTPIVVLLPSVVVFGLLVERHLDRARRSDKNQEKASEENTHLKEEIAKLRDVNVGLAGKVVGADATFQRLYRYAKVLNVRDTDQIYRGLLLMLEEVVGASVSSIWISSGNEMRLHTRRGRDDQLPVFRLDNLVLAHFDAHGVLSLHDVPEASRYPGLPYLVGRIQRGRGGPTVAYATIDKIPFSRYNAETIRFFTLAIDWVSSSVENAGKLAEAAPDDMRSTVFDADALQPQRRETVVMKGPTLGLLLEEIERHLGGEEMK
jgi:hypothetical protein